MSDSIVSGDFIDSVIGIKDHDSFDYHTEVVYRSSSDVNERIETIGLSVSKIRKKNDMVSSTIESMGLFNRILQWKYIKTIKGISIKVDGCMEELDTVLSKIVGSAMTDAQAVSIYLTLCDIYRILDELKVNMDSLSNILIDFEKKAGSMDIGSLNQGIECKVDDIHTMYSPLETAVA